MQDAATFCVELRLFTRIVYETQATHVANLPRHKHQIASLATDKKALIVLSG